MIIFRMKVKYWKMSGITPGITVSNEIATDMDSMTTSEFTKRRQYVLDFNLERLAVNWENNFCHCDTKGYIKQSLTTVAYAIHTFLQSSLVREIKSQVNHICQEMMARRETSFGIDYSSLDNKHHVYQVSASIQRLQSSFLSNTLKSQKEYLAFHVVAAPPVISYYRPNYHRQGFGQLYGTLSCTKIGMVQTWQSKSGGSNTLKLSINYTRSCLISCAIFTSTPPPGKKQAQYGLSRTGSSSSAEMKQQREGEMHSLNRRSSLVSIGIRQASTVNRGVITHNMSLPTKRLLSPPLSLTRSKLYALYGTKTLPDCTLYCNNSGQQDSAQSDVMYGTKAKAVTNYVTKALPDTLSVTRAKSDNTCSTRTQPDPVYGTWAKLGEQSYNYGVGLSKQSSTTATYQQVCYTRQGSITMKQRLGIYTKHQKFSQTNCNQDLSYPGWVPGCFADNKDEIIYQKGPVLFLLKSAEVWGNLNVMKRSSILKFGEWVIKPLTTVNYFSCQNSCPLFQT